MTTPIDPADEPTPAPDARALDDARRRLKRAHERVMKTYDAAFRRLAK